MQAMHIGTKALFPLSPYLYMQFMEPLGTADSSVDAAWDYVLDRWRPEVLTVARRLSPAMLRWGGCFASYYHWMEGVGPREERPAMLNLCWGGMFSNHVGTAEVMDFCRDVGAEPLFTVNMESDGRSNWARPKEGVNRLGDAAEAAAWVDYCNNPDNALRRAHGYPTPFSIRYWQIGNETSYDPDGFHMEEAASVTRTFAREMRKADPNIRLIAWGDSGWAGRMCEVAGDDIDYIAIHHHFNHWNRESPVFNWNHGKDFDQAWAIMLDAHKSLQERLDAVRAEVAPYHKRVALTEGHFDIKGRNRSDLMSCWVAGVAYGRCLNVLERNGDIVDIATMADFLGNRWQVNALLIPTPMRKNPPYLQPVGEVMALFRRHMGSHTVSVDAPSGLDVSASMAEGKLFLHVVNPDASRSVEVVFDAGGAKITGGFAHTIAADPREMISEFDTQVFQPVTQQITGNRWTFPAASVTAVELNLSRND